MKYALVSLIILGISSLAYGTNSQELSELLKKTKATKNIVKPPQGNS